MVPKQSSPLRDLQVVFLFGVIEKRPGKIDTAALRCRGDSFGAGRTGAQPDCQDGQQCQGNDLKEPFFHGGNSSLPECLFYLYYGAAGKKRSFFLYVRMPSDAFAVSSPTGIFPVPRIRFP